MDGCQTCNSPIHRLFGCSVPLNEDERRRICMNCANKRNISQNIALNEIENHNGLGLKDLRKENRKNNLYFSGAKSGKIKE